MARKKGVMARPLLPVLQGAPSQPMPIHPLAMGTEEMGRFCYRTVVMETQENPQLHQIFLNCPKISEQQCPQCGKLRVKLDSSTFT